jgi:hypothetical protein
LRWKLEHRRFLIFNYVSQQYGLPVWKLQRIVMCARVILVDLPEDGGCVGDRVCLPIEQSAWAAPYGFGKGKLRSRKNTNGHARIFRRSKSASAGIEVASGQFVANPGGT